MSVSPNQLLLESLLNEIEKLRQIRTEAAVNWRDFAEKAPETLRDLRGIAGNLADIYQGAENAFQRIIRATEENLVDLIIADLESFCLFLEQME